MDMADARRDQGRLAGGQVHRLQRGTFDPHHPGQAGDDGRRGMVLAVAAAAALDQEDAAEPAAQRAGGDPEMREITVEEEGHAVVKRRLSSGPGKGNRLFADQPCSLGAPEV